MNKKQGHLNIEVSGQEYDDVEIWWLLVQTGRAMDRFRDRELLEHGISRQEAGVLIAIDMIGHRSTQAEISRWTLKVSHSISAIVARMEARGLVRNARDLERKNLSRIVLTKKGKQALSQIAKRESMHGLLGVLSKEERQQLMAIIFKLRDTAIEKLGAKKPPFPQQHQMSN